jgi:hypothetical protein
MVTVIAFSRGGNELIFAHLMSSAENCCGRPEFLAKIEIVALHHDEAN